MRYRADTTGGSYGARYYFNGNYQHETHAVHRLMIVSDIARRSY